MKLRVQDLDVEQRKPGERLRRKIDGSDN